MGTPARVVVLPQEPAPLRIEEINLPDPGPNQVIVKQFASGICHSQLHQMHRPRENPIILGHESTGVILMAGKAVSHVKEGDTVLVAPGNYAENLIMVGAGIRLIGLGFPATDRGVSITPPDMTGSYPGSMIIQGSGMEMSNLLFIKILCSLKIGYFCWGVGQVGFIGLKVIGVRR